MSYPETIFRLRDVLRETLAPLLPHGEPYALLDYPAYANVGDSAIWLGALRLLDESGAGEPAYTCTAKTYDATALRQRVGTGPILVTGGGNFGDVYTSSQTLREQVVRDFPENRILQLPQTIRYRREEALAASRRTLEAHRDFTLLTRDEQSLAIAREGLGVRSMLCPDLAFALAPLPRPEPQGHGIVWLLREDGEARTGRLGSDDGVEPVDWPSDPKRGVFAIQRRLRKRVARKPAKRAHLAGLMRRTFTPVARRRVQRGCAMLGAGRAVVTDRLHGHVLSLLMGIPHVVLDNSYGKNRRFYEAWTHDAPNARWCEGPAASCLGLLDEVAPV